MKRHLLPSTTFCDVAIFGRLLPLLPLATLTLTTFFRDAVFLLVASHRHLEFRVTSRDGVTLRATLCDGVMMTHVDVTMARVTIRDGVTRIRDAVMIHRDVF